MQDIKTIEDLETVLKTAAVNSEIKVTGKGDKDTPDQFTITVTVNGDPHTFTVCGTEKEGCLPLKNVIEVLKRPISTVKLVVEDFIGYVSYGGVKPMKTKIPLTLWLMG